MTGFRIVAVNGNSPSSSKSHSVSAGEFRLCGCAGSHRDDPRSFEAGAPGSRLFQVSVSLDVTCDIKGILSLFHFVLQFRHLDSQLLEIRNAIEKMLRSELERNLSGDLNRPIEQISLFYDKVSIGLIMHFYL